MMSSESMAAFAAAAEQPDYEEQGPPQRPILFSGPMVRAILDGHKTRTRRVLTPQPQYVAYPESVGGGGFWGWQKSPRMFLDDVHSRFVDFCPYGQPGHELWVRETWAKPGEVEDNTSYRADNPDPLAGKWRPSIHMPRWASRLTLEITEVRVERLQSITNVEAEKEGVTHYDCGHPDCFDNEGTPGKHFGPRAAFMELWNKLNEKRGYGWAVNPWVWVIGFKRITP